MSTQPVIRVQNLTKHYGSFSAVENVSFDLDEGEIVGFVGLNGAGKSTTINTMLGFLRPSSGSIELFGQNIVPETAHRVHRQVGFASGDMSLFTNLRGSQYFSFLSSQYGLKDDKRAKELIKRFAPDLKKRIGDLSRGNRQKIALIGAFLASPKVIILDEPSSGLDPLMQQEFLELIREEAGRGTTVFMSSHYLNEVADVCQRILLIRDGKLVRDIAASELVTGSGKLIRVLSRETLNAPAQSELVHREHTNAGEELSFAYKGQVHQLQKWLTSVHGLLDLSVADHDLEAAFEDLYEKKESK